jgi:xanthine dehydrogenase YagR molybdenum-binding subunit
VGELAGLGIVASIANAIHNATGARLRQTPMTAEKVLEAMLREREKKR